MKLKPLIVTVVALALLSAVVFVVRRPAPSVADDPRVGQPLVTQAMVAKAAQLRVTDQGKTLTLVRQSDGTWIVPEYFGLPADFAKLSNFASSLAAAKLERLVTTNPERISRLEFKDTKVALLDAAGKELWSATLGKNAESGGGRYVRFGDEPKAFLTNLNVWIEITPKNWAETRLLDLKPETIARVEVPFAEGGPVTISRSKKDGPWTSAGTPAGQRVNAGKVSSLLSSLGDVRFTDTVATNAAGVAPAKAHERTVKLTTFDGKTYTIALGRKPEEKKLKQAAPAPTADKEEPVEKKNEGGEKVSAPNSREPGPAGAKESAAKPKEPEYETIPAGPAYAFISCSDSAAPINELMQKRAFEIAEYVLTGLPQKPADLFEPLPADSKKSAEQTPGGQQSTTVLPPPVKKTDETKKTDGKEKTKPAAEPKKP